MAELIDYDELSDAALDSKLRELRAANDTLRGENALFESYLGRQGVSSDPRRCTGADARRLVKIY